MRKVDNSEMIVVEAGKLCLGKLTGTEGYWGIFDFDDKNGLDYSKCNIGTLIGTGGELGYLFTVFFVIPNIITLAKGVSKSDNKFQIQGWLFWGNKPEDF